MSKIETIKINEVEYVRKDSISQTVTNTEGLEYVIVRTRSAGVFAGYLKSREGQEAVMLNARRLWQWAGAASLSQLAMEGSSNPGSCKFPQEVDKIQLFEVIEILSATKKCKDSIDSVKVWKV